MTSRRRWNGFLMLCTLLLLCAEASAGPLPKLPATALPVPIIPQATSYSCGAAALFATLLYWDAYEGHELDLHKPLGTTPLAGTLPEAMARFARESDLKADVRTGMTIDDLRLALILRKTVIVDIQAWPERNKDSPWQEHWEDGHYVVLIGMDDNYAYFMDPSLQQGYGYISLSELPDRWHDYEEINGEIVRNIHLGIVISGTTPAISFPALEPIL